jgi:acetyltransferase-like isoleucine patch superfamily enzyme
MGRALAWFPAAQLTLIVGAAVAFVMAPGAWTLLAVGFAVYGLPLCLFRLLTRVCPVREGISHLEAPRYSAWWGSHQLQVLYLSVPALEALLRLVPGLFSLWLRAWGSTVGRAVYWTPGLEVADRSLLAIGDRVIVGHRVGLYSHVVTPRNGHLVLYVKRISIGCDVFVGAGSQIGPGARIDDGACLPVRSDLYPNTHIRKESGSDAAAGHRRARARSLGAIGPSSPGDAVRA